MYGADVEQIAIELNEDPQKLATFEEIGRAHV